MLTIPNNMLNSIWLAVPSFKNAIPAVSTNRRHVSKISNHQQLGS